MSDRPETVMDRARARRAQVDTPPPAPVTRRPPPMVNTGPRAPVVPTFRDQPPPAGAPATLLSPGILASAAIAALFVLAIAASVLLRPPAPMAAPAAPAPAEAPQAPPAAPQAPAPAVEAPAAPEAPQAPAEAAPGSFIAPIDCTRPADEHEIIACSPAPPPPAAGPARPIAPAPAFAPAPAAAPPAPQAAPADLVPLEPTPAQRVESRPASGAMWRDRP